MFRNRSRIETTIRATLVLAGCFGVWRILPSSFRQQIEPIVHATSIYTVNTTDDHDDGVCNAADCTLREAAVAPPIVMLLAFIRMPPAPFVLAAVPVAFMPM